MLGKLLADRIARLLDAIDSDPRMQHLIETRQAGAQALRGEVRTLHARLMEGIETLRLEELASTLARLRERCTPELVHCVDPLDHAILLVKEAIGPGQGRARPDS